MFDWLLESITSIFARAWRTAWGEPESQLEAASGVLWLVLLMCLITAFLPLGLFANAAASGASLLAMLAFLDWLGWALVLGFQRLTAEPQDAVVRGAELVPGPSLKKEIMRNARREQVDISNWIVIGGVPVPPSDEPLNFLFAGSPGTGKSQAINGTLDIIRGRGDRVVMADAGGEAMARWWQEGDILLNPFDARTRDWSPFAEMEGPWDAGRLAKSIIPDYEGTNREWSDYSQSLVEAILVRLWERGNATNGQILYYLTMARAQEIAGLVQGLPCQTLFDDGAAKMLSSVRGIIGSTLGPWRFLNPKAGADGFSIRRWVLEDSTSWLWVPYRDDMRSTLAPLIGTWLDLTVSTLMSQRSDPTRRLFLVLDELPALGKVNSLSNALAQGRRYGLVCLAGIQTIAQLRERYGAQTAQILLNCFSNRLVLRSVDPETADYLSRILGEREIEREETSTSESDGGSSRTSALRRKQERAVLPAEIQKLRSRTGFLDLVELPVATVDIPVVTKDEVVEPFILRAPEPTPETPKVAPPPETPTAKPKKIVVPEF